MADPFLDYFTRPYDDLIQADNRRMDEILSTREALRDKRSSLDDTTATEYGQLFGSFLLPALAGTASGNLTSGLDWGTKSGVNYLTDLHRKEEEQKKLIDQDVLRADDELKFLRESGRGYGLARANRMGDLGLQYFTGGVPGTEPFNLEQQAITDRALATAAAGNRGGNELFSTDEVNKMLGNNIFPSGQQVSSRDVSAAAALKGSVNSDNSLNYRVSQGVVNRMASGIPGYVPVPGFQPSEKIDKFRELESFRQAGVSSLDELEALMKRRVAEGNDPLALMGNDARLIQMLGKSVIPWARQYAGTGASLTGKGPAGEISQLQAFAPPDTDTITGSGLELAARKFKGQDPIAYVQSLRDTMNRLTKQRSYAYNIYDPSARDAYDPETIKTIESLAPKFGYPQAWGDYADMISGANQVNPIYRQQAELMGAPTPAAVPTAPAVQTSTPTPIPPSINIPEGAVDKKKFRNSAGQEKLFWVDASGNRLSEAQ